MDPKLANYYAARAAEYEKVYEKPERQADLAVLRRVVPGFFRGRRVLEVACGTGYWTVLVAGVAESVLATDVGQEVMELARAKAWPPNSRVSFRAADVFELAGIPTDFNAALAAFWFSHVRREDVSAFLTTLNAHVAPGGRVVLVDNRFVKGSNHPISRTDAGGNTFQLRKEGGETYEVLKNFPMRAELQRWLHDSGAHDIEIVELTYYWYATYRTTSP